MSLNSLLNPLSFPSNSNTNKHWLFHMLLFVCEKFAHTFFLSICFYYTVKASWQVILRDAHPVCIVTPGVTRGHKWHGVGNACEMACHMLGHHSQNPPTFFFILSFHTHWLAMSATVCTMMMLVIENPVSQGLIKIFLPWFQEIVTSRERRIVSWFFTIDRNEIAKRSRS